MFRIDVDCVDEAFDPLRCYYAQIVDLTGKIVDIFDEAGEPIPGNWKLTDPEGLLEVGVLEQKVYHVAFYHPVTKLIAARLVIDEDDMYDEDEIFDGDELEDDFIEGLYLDVVKGIDDIEEGADIDEDILAAFEEAHPFRFVQRLSYTGEILKRQKSSVEEPTEQEVISQEAVDESLAILESLSAKAKSRQLISKVRAKSSPSKSKRKRNND